MARFRVEVKAREFLRLPPYKGSAMRGALGHALSRVGCFCPVPRVDIEHRDDCVYRHLFEPVASKGEHGPRGLKAVPQPFVLEPPTDARTEYTPGEMFAFDFLLIGKAIPYLPYFLAAIEVMGFQGIGKGKGRYRIERLLKVDAAGSAAPLDLSRLLLEGDSKDVHTADDVCRAHPCPSPLQMVTLDFITPARLKFGNHLCDAPEFHVLFRNLARRISLLSYFHCGGEWRQSIAEEIRMAEEVKVVRNALNWNDWRRYSNRQEEEMYLGGFMGRLGFRGDLESFWPYLLLGSHLHVGKGATFGLGKYVIQTLPGLPPEASTRSKTSLPDRGTSERA
jgi:hypothetical protein